MSTIKKMTIEEVKAIPPLSDEAKKIINEANPVESDDCPFMTREDLEEFRHWSKVHPEWYKPTKSKITIMIDNDGLQPLRLRARDISRESTQSLEKKSWEPDACIVICISERIL